MSDFGASSTMTWSARFLLAFSVLALGGCWGGDLARKDRDVRASWAALQSADQMAVDLARRIASTWQRSVDDPALRSRFGALATLIRSRDFDIGDHSEVARYGAYRSRVLDYLRATAETLASPASAGLAWKLRRLRRECSAALLRADNALLVYNEAALAYNRALSAAGGNVSKALLFPGRRQFALLEVNRNKRMPDRR